MNSICWSFSYDYSLLASATSSQRESVFSDKDNTKHLLGLQLRNLFKYAELTEVVRQNDKLFIVLLIKLHLAILMIM